jgi:alpha-D-xyloside xylohydrolase
MFRINFITPGKAKPLDFDARCDREVVYEGKTLSIKI